MKSAMRKVRKGRIAKSIKPADKASVGVILSAIKEWHNDPQNLQNLASDIKNSLETDEYKSIQKLSRIDHYGYTRPRNK